MQGELEDSYQSKNIVETDRYYRVVSRSYNDNLKRVSKNIEYKEYEYKWKRYVRVIAAPCYMNVELSNGQECKGKDIVWVEVEPIKWLVEKKSKLLLSKK